VGRVRIPIGTFGDINTTPTSPGRWRARAKFRDQDGYCALEASGPSSKAAEQALKVKLAKRTRIGSSMGDLHPHSPFPDLVRVWLEDLELDTDLAQGTRDLYERDMRTLVLPVFEHFVLREITISKVDRFLRTLAKESYSRAKHAKVVLNLSLGLAHRYEAIERNPVTGGSGRSRGAPRRSWAPSRCTWLGSGGSCSSTQHPMGSTPCCGGLETTGT
jgi:hypothetical protein